MLFSTAVLSHLEVGRSIPGDARYRVLCRPFVGVRTYDIFGPIVLTAEILGTNILRANVPSVGVSSSVSPASLLAI